MRRDLGSASGQDRQEECRASTVLSVVESTSPDAAAGQAVHAFLCDLNTLGRDAALARAPAVYRPICEVMDPADYPTDPKAYAAEVAYAYHVTSGTARELGRNIGRRYLECGLVLGEEVPGSADITALVGRDTVYVGDYKRGGRHLPPAREARQLRFLALAACRTYGRERATVEFIRIFDGETKPWRDRAELDAFDLDDYAVELRRRRDRILADREAYEKGGVIPPASMGDWCRYCASFQFCDAQTGLMRRALDGQLDARVTPENAAEAYGVWRRLEALTKEFEREVKGYARETTFRLPNGKAYGFVPSDSDVIDGVKAEPVLVDLFGEKATALIVEKSITKGSLEDGVRAYLKANPKEDYKGAVPILVEKARKLLLEGGALAIAPGGSVKEHKASARLPARPTLRALPSPSPSPSAEAEPEPRPQSQPAPVAEAQPALDASAAAADPAAKPALVPGFKDLSFDFS